MITRISQSFMKDFREFLEGNECGVIIKAKYVDDRILDDPDEEPGAKELGIYFEFLISGALPVNGQIPKPVLLKDGRMSAEYRLATINAKRVTDMFESLGLKVIASNKTLTKGRHRGKLDLIVEYIGVKDEHGNLIDLHFDNGIVWRVGDRFWIDTKYSGLLGDTVPAFNKHGWKWSKVQKKYHGTQAKQYTFISDIPGYFLVTKSNNKEGTLSEMRLFHTPVTQAMMDDHLSEGNYLFDTFNKMAEKNLGFAPRPSYMKCSECPLKNECQYKHTFPHPELINLEDD